MLFLENLIRALLIFNGLQSHHCQRALLVYHYRPERCLEIVEQRVPDGFADLGAVISRAELEEIARSYKRTAAFDPEVLNNRPSLAVAQPSAHGR